MSGLVSPSSQRMDYLTKLFKYRAAGVREYWIVDPEKETVFAFSDTAPVGIYRDFKINISELLN